MSHDKELSFLEAEALCVAVALKGTLDQVSNVVDLDVPKYMALRR